MVDGSARIDVTVGDASPDACDSGTANALLAVPVHVQVWQDRSGVVGSCPAVDGTYDPDDGDVLIQEFTHTLDFTTDATQANWVDLDGDGCSLAGTGPSRQPVPFGGGHVSEVCRPEPSPWWRPGRSVPPWVLLRDVTVTTTLPNTSSGPAAPLNAVCDMAPPLSVGGTTSRCIE